MLKLEIYEDNGGGLHLCILDETGNCTSIFGNWEYNREPGALLDAYDQIKNDTGSYLYWDGDEVDFYDREFTAQELYDRTNFGDLIAWTDDAGQLQTISRDRMGAAGRKALDYNRGNI